MGYWTGEDLPWAYSLAATFPLADRWFAPVLGQTQPNRRYLLAATSVGMVDDILPENLLPAPEGTIFDRLDAHHIPWRNYYSSFPPTSYLFLGDAIRDHASVVPIAQFFADAKSGNLPGFAIIDPDFGRSSGENPQNIVHAEVFAASVVQAVMESPAWPRTLLVWTFDEGGGYYDHVPPPAAVAPDAHPAAATGRALRRVRPVRIPGPGGRGFPVEPGRSCDQRGARPHLDPGHGRAQMEPAGDDTPRRSRRRPVRFP